MRYVTDAGVGWGWGVTEGEGGRQQVPTAAALRLTRVRLVDGRVGGNREEDNVLLPVRFLCRPAATDATDGVLFPPHSVMPPPPPSCSVPPVPIPAAPNPPQDQVALLVRRGAASDARPLRAVNLHALLRPFSRDAWLLVLAALVVWMAAAAAAAARVPTPVARQWSLRRRALQWLYNLYVGRDT